MEEATIVERVGSKNSSSSRELKVEPSVYEYSENQRPNCSPEEKLFLNMDHQDKMVLNLDAPNNSCYDGWQSDVLFQTFEQPLVSTPSQIHYSGQFESAQSQPSQSIPQLQLSQSTMSSQLRFRLRDYQQAGE